MPPFVPSFQTDQFDNTNPARGDLSEAIAKSGVLAGVLTAGTLHAGDRVKLDSTVTTPGFIGFVAAADNEVAFGVIKRTVKQATFIATTDPGGSEDTNKVEVAFAGGQAVYEVGGTTLTPGTPVAMSSGFLAAVDGTHLQMGLLIDYVTQSSVGRVIIGWEPA